VALLIVDQKLLPTYKMAPAQNDQMKFCQGNFLTNCYPRYFGIFIRIWIEDLCDQRKDIYNHNILLFVGKEWNE